MSEDTENEQSNSAVPLPAWAHACGLLDLKESCRPVNPDALADRLLCMERIARYCWAYDERRLDLLAACFIDDGIWEGNVLGRVPVGPFTGRARIGKWLSGFWPHQKDQRRHMLLNTIVEDQTSDSVLTLSYLQLLSSDSKRVQLETTGFYRVRYAKDQDQWRIARLTAGFDAPFWPGDIETMSASGRARHGVSLDKAKT
jgi:SnoaL-like domain